MLFLLFHLGQDRYVLDVRQVIEVLPLLGIMAMPQAPIEVAGLCNHRGTLVPVIDLSQVMLGRPAQRRLHTRIVLAKYSDDSDVTRSLGLIVEKVTETLQREATDFNSSGVSLPHLGRVALDRDGLTQRIEVNQLLPKSVRELLFQSQMQS